MKSKSLVLALFLFHQQGFADIRSFTVQNFREFDLEAQSGDIEITTAVGKNVIVDFHKKDASFFDKNCTLHFENTDKKVKVKVAPVPSFKGDCSVQFKATIPESVEVDLTSGDGKATFNGNYRKIEVKLGKGDFKVDGSVYSLEVQIGNGKVMANKIHKKAMIKIGNGDVDVSFTEGHSLDIRIGNGNTKASFETLAEEADLNFKMGNGNLDLLSRKNPKKAKIDVHTGFGNIDLKMDAKTTLRLYHKSGKGTLRNELSISDKSDFRLDVSQGSGDLKIHSAL
jgi:DUF4097 and DUF4098 domain-containing protein YvlB